MWLCGPLLGVWADVGAAAGDGEDQSFGAEDLDGVQDRVTADVVLLLELLAWSWTAPRPRTGDRREDDLRGPLFDLLTAVLAMGEHV
jgi:hypothetical protein